MIDGEQDIDTDSDVAVAEGDLKPKAPQRYAVILHNDDYTTMEFVVETLQNIFHKSSQEAFEIMVRIHHQGSGVAGIYSHEIAETKADQTIRLARAKGFPLLCTLEPTT